jgi:hypothetical protein
VNGKRCIFVSRRDSAATPLVPAEAAKSIKNATERTLEHLYKKRKHRATSLYPMFSGGEKNSCSSTVIGNNTEATLLKKASIIFYASGV